MLRSCRSLLSGFIARASRAFTQDQVQWHVRTGQMNELLRFESPCDAIYEQLNTLIQSLEHTNSRPSRNDPPSETTTAAQLINLIKDRLGQDYRDCRSEQFAFGFYYSVEQDQPHQLRILTKIPASNRRDSNAIMYGIEVRRAGQDQYQFWPE